MRRRVAMWMAAVAVSLSLSGCGGDSPSPPPGTPASSGSATAAAGFLAEYVTADGRVIRHDQGGDIVSEGQAYGMLIAELADRPSVVRAIWSWTEAHLRRSDGLLDFHATGSGQVEDGQSAADADVLAAYALLRYTGPGEDALHLAGRQIADAVLAHETVNSGADVVVAAGPWATATEPPTVNPSYLMPSVFAALGRFTGDGRWQQAATSAVALLDQLTDGGQTLPTDWAALADGRLVPIANPDGSTPLQYGLDAARLPIWFATDCGVRARQLAGRWWTNALSHDGSAADLALSPDGVPISDETNPVPLLAAAAAANAAGDRHASASLRTRAAQQAREVPTYFGDAWLALGTALLERSLDPCHEPVGD